MPPATFGTGPARARPAASAARRALLVALLPPGLFACAPRRREPPEQLAFVEGWRKLLAERRAASESGNALKVREVHKRIDAYFEQAPKVQGWLAEVQGVEKTLLSGLQVIARHDDVVFVLEAGGDAGRALEPTLTGLARDDRIAFSGRYAGEATWTLLREIETPQVRVQLAALERLK